MASPQQRQTNEYNDPLADHANRGTYQVVGTSGVAEAAQASPYPECLGSNGNQPCPPHAGCRLTRKQCAYQRCSPPNGPLNQNEAPQRGARRRLSSGGCLKPDHNPECPPVFSALDAADRCHPGAAYCP